MSAETFPIDTASSGFAEPAARQCDSRVVTPPGRGAEAWRATIDAAPTIEVAEVGGAMTSFRRLVALSAHPDDETIGAGRLIAGWARQQGMVLAITLTAGEACLDHLEVTVPELAKRRLMEWRAAVTVLGAQPGSCWGFGDGRVGLVVQEAADRLARGLGTDDLLLAPWRHDPHPDHAAAGEIARRAAERSGASIVEYPVWMTYWSDPSELERTGYQLLRINTDAAADSCREQALAQYISQQQPLRPGLSPVVPPAMLKHHDRQLILRPREEGTGGQTSELRGVVSQRR